MKNKSESLFYQYHIYEHKTNGISTQKILEAIGEGLDKFRGKEHIISGFGRLHGTESFAALFTETDPDKFFVLFFYAFYRCLAEFIRIELTYEESFIFGEGIVSIKGF